MGNGKRVATCENGKHKPKAANNGRGANPPNPWQQPTRMRMGRDESEGTARTGMTHRNTSKISSMMTSTYVRLATLFMSNDDMTCTPSSNSMSTTIFWESVPNAFTAAALPLVRIPENMAAIYGGAARGAWGAVGAPGRISGSCGARGRRVFGLQPSAGF